MTTKIFSATLLALAVFASPAMAASSGTVTTDLNLRAGPSTQYPVVTSIPSSSSVLVYGCNADVSWCDTAYGGHRGWASAKYIQITGSGAPVVVTPAAVAAVGLPVVAYNRAYWDTYYKAYPWYRTWPGYYGQPVRTTTGCVGAACGARQTTTGPYGGTAARSGGCYNGKCAGTKRVTGPQGNTYRKSGACNGRTGNCWATRSGPRGRRW